MLLTKKLQKYLKYFRYAIILFCVFTVFYLCRRFSIIHVSLDLMPLQDIPAESYMLIDWQFHKGRSVSIGDYVIYEIEGHSQYAVGYIAAPPDSLIWGEEGSLMINGHPSEFTYPAITSPRHLSSNEYLIYNQSVKSGTGGIRNLQDIKGRILIILGSSNQRGLPKDY